MNLPLSIEILEERLGSHVRGLVSISDSLKICF